MILSDSSSLGSPETSLVHAFGALKMPPVPGFPLLDPEELDDEVDELPLELELLIIPLLLLPLPLLLLLDPLSELPLDPVEGLSSPHAAREPKNIATTD